MPTKHCRVRFLAMVALVVLAGCGTGELSEQEKDRMRQSLDQGLTAWKKGESAKKWSDSGAAIRFVDNDWIKKYQLKEYQIVDVSMGASGHAEAIVKLTIKADKGKVLEREALYTLHPQGDNQIIISRDPMH
jgi:hypothetical protein